MVFSFLLVFLYYFIIFVILFYDVILVLPGQDFSFSFRIFKFKFFIQYYI